MRPSNLKNARQWPFHDTIHCEGGLRSLLPLSYKRDRIGSLGRPKARRALCTLLRAQGQSLGHVSGCCHCYSYCYYFSCGDLSRVPCVNEFLCAIRHVRQQRQI